MNASSRGDAWVAAMPAVFVLVWSTGFVVARLAMPHAPPLGFLAWRYAMSIVLFVCWVLASRAPRPASWAQIGHLAVTGVLMHAGYLGGVWAAVKAGLGAGTAALIVGLQPLLTAVWMSRQGAAHRVEWRQWLGLALGFGGLVLVVWERLGAGHASMANVAMALVALVSITAGTLYQKRFVAPCDVRSAAAVQLTAALLVTLPFAALEHESLDWASHELHLALAWSVVVLTLGGSSLLYLLIQRGAATQVSSLMYLVPPCTAVLAWLMFDEPISAAVVAGMALAALGVSLVLRPVAPRARARPN